MKHRDSHMISKYSTTSHSPDRFPNEGLSLALVIRTPLLHIEIKPAVYCHRNFSSLKLFSNIFMLNEWNLIFSSDSTNLSSLTPRPKQSRFQFHFSPLANRYRSYDCYLLIPCNCRYILFCHLFSLLLALPLIVA